MKSSRIVKGAALVLALLGVVACGGTDPVPDEGSGGSGQGGSASAGFPVGAGSGGASSGEGGEYVDPYEVCAAFFADAADAGCPLHPTISAEDYCSEELHSTDDCESLRFDLFQCQADRLASSGCGSEGPCEDARLAYAHCIYPSDGSGETTCEVSPEDGDRVCTTTSSEHVFRSECSTRETGTFACSCYVDDEVQGSCLGDIADDTSGCCRSFFAEAA